MKIERLDPAIRLSWQKKDEMKHFVSTEMGAQSFFIRKTSKHHLAASLDGCDGTHARGTIKKVRSPSNPSQAGGGAGCAKKDAESAIT